VARPIIVKPEGGARARQAVPARPDDAPEQRAARIGDFFALDACRDLLFRVQTIRPGLPDIAAFPASQGLAFLGFELSPHVMSRYAMRFPGDTAKTNLDRWHMFEQENPDIFIATREF